MRKKSKKSIKTMLTFLTAVSAGFLAKSYISDKRKASAIETDAEVEAVEEPADIDNNVTE